MCFGSYGFCGGRVRLFVDVRECHVDIRVEGCLTGRVIDGVEVAAIVVRIFVIKISYR